MDDLTRAEYDQWRDLCERLLRARMITQTDLDSPVNKRLPLYASDHDMFAFIASANTVNEPGNPDGLRRGLVVANSEVGASTLMVLRFLYREMCGNHIIWGAEERDRVEGAARRYDS